MSLDAKGAAALALHRFGLGPRVGSIAAIASDPRGALLAELDKPGAGQAIGYDLISSAQAARKAFLFNQTRQAQQIATKMAEEKRAEEMRAAGDVQMNMAMAEQRPEEQPAQQAPRGDTPLQNIFREVKARTDAAMNAEIGF